ncbi:hypothetical protein ACFOGJ_17700 [Marinibaculum pumilum]|uniref:PAS domain-containing protein n=1 Tax=Marinibaculum pumilum TaxID=1766165 RepID=A0ABV7L3A2_9PROT
MGYSQTALPGGEGPERAAGEGAGAGGSPWDSPGVHVAVTRRDLPTDLIGQRLFAVWHRLRDRNGGMPPWIDVAALDVADAVPGAILALPDGGRSDRFRASFVGAEVRRIWGDDFTGRVMHSRVFPEMSDAVTCGMAKALQEGRPVAAEYRVQIAFRISYLHVAFLPFMGPRDPGSRNQSARYQGPRVLVHLNFSNITVRDARDWRTTLETQSRIQRLLDSQEPG